MEYVNFLASKVPHRERDVLDILDWSALGNAKETFLLLVLFDPLRKLPFSDV